MEPNFLLINKPIDWTSHDVVGYVRKKMTNRLHPENSGLRRVKVGHAGTLDPFATGLLIVGVGREATKRLDEFKALPKTYVATLRLGATSDTYDRTGTIVTNDKFLISNQAQNTNDQTQIENTLQNFIGKQLQVPPMFSAKKVGGKRLYKLARQGVEIERLPDEIEIYDIKILNYDFPLLTIEVHCSTGTYIRSLAHDIGQQLGVGAYCEALTRIAIGEYRVEDAKEVKDI